MKTLHKTNFFALVITLALYLTVYLGMCAQVILGPLQLLLALVISFNYYKKLNKPLKNHLLTYWLTAAISLIIAYLSWTHNTANDYVIITVFVIPMLIACYFVYVTYKITQHLSTLKP